MDIVSESAPYPTSCGWCGSTADATVTEALVGDDHRWDIDAECSTCESVWYECGYEPPLPQSVRDALLVENGATVLRLEADTSAAVVMKALRVARSLSLSEARSLADTAIETGLEGTLVEMQVIARLLHRSGRV
ncbi:hypothetical protein [Nocardia amikacinitolerans]|uniref:hypothetical protein n=1 Tax=Nocardia amikacinitolerans TaxID=756689 RepID=UPI0020A5F5CB|nr:hypothetical protein [Nocardia amikacinitolerans]MCP2287800.1 hypothetical protein [Nocardia amikacinitolerans]